MNKIGVLTSGGDAPGMNAAVMAVARSAAMYNMPLVGIKRGYNGLLRKSTSLYDDMEEMRLDTVLDIADQPGTYLRTARCMEFMDPAWREVAANTLRAMGIDSYALSGHKIHGPKGIGALAYGERVRLTPRALGGGQEKNLRSGTENVPGILGLMEAIRAYPEENEMRALKLRLHDRLQAIAGENFYVNGPLPDSPHAAPHILNCSLVPVRSETMIYALEADHVYVAAGSACSSHKQKVSTVLTAMQVPRRVAESALRFSLSPFTTAEEIDYAADCIARHYEMLKRYERR